MNKNTMAAINKLVAEIDRLHTIGGSILVEDLEPWIVTLGGEYKYQFATSVGVAVELEEHGYHIRHAGEVMISRLAEFIGYYVRHNGDQWAILINVEPSKIQGWDVILDGGVRLQCCTVEGSYMIARSPTRWSVRND